jgi:uncharacterized protein
VLDGNNADDRGDYRPGRQAAREHGVRSPLDEVGLTKAEIRELSRAAGMATWTSPHRRACRRAFPTTTRSPSEKLRMVEQAEDALRALGFRVCRVRHHDTLARLELGRDEIARGARRRRARPDPLGAARGRLPSGGGRPSGVSYGQPE